MVLKVFFSLLKRRTRKDQQSVKRNKKVKGSLLFPKGGFNDFHKALLVLPFVPLFQPSTSFLGHRRPFPTTTQPLKSSFSLQHVLSPSGHSRIHHPQPLRATPTQAFSALRLIPVQSYSVTEDHSQFRHSLSPQTIHRSVILGHIQPFPVSHPQSHKTIPNSNTLGHIQPFPVHKLDTRLAPSYLSSLSSFQCSMMFGCLPVV